MQRQVRKMQYAVRAIGKRNTRKEFARAARRFEQERAREQEQWRVFVEENQRYCNNVGRLVAYE